MPIENLGIEGPLLITPDVFSDDRGYFFESWNRRRFASALGLDPDQTPNFVQDNQSCSSRGVLRGLHYQVAPMPQAKLVRCVHGEIFDVAVDLRTESVSFGHWVAARLSGENNQQLWVPHGFAHGFLTLSDTAIVLYKTDAHWNRDCERGIRWNDAAVGIDWPLAGLDLQLTEKDAAAPSLAAAREAGDVFAALRP